ncbi:MAG: calcium/sodium antiporter [Chitinivibrionia bacterium]|nr:calcium/sodium antiporter [Chitinivibrionia bacterium]
MVLINILLIVLGMALLVKGGDILVDGSSSLARRFNVSELAIGLTVVAFGTSAPELVVSLSAALGSHPEIALGNVIGSNNFNLFFILGATGLIAPLAVQRNTVRFEIPFSLFAAIIMFLLANFAFPFAEDEKDMVTRIDGIILLVFFVLFIFYVFKSMKNGETADVKNTDAKTFSLLKSILFIVFGLVFLVVGGKIVVDSAVFLATALNISEKVIGLTIVAIGTSLPELVTSIAAVLKKSDDIAIGNIIGSNIFNIFLILGASATVCPMEYSPIFNRDIYFLFFGTTLLILAMFTGKKRKLDRWESAVLLLLYVGYVVYLIMQNE